MSAVGENAILVTDSITKLTAADAGKVVVSGSHGGIFPAHLAAKARVKAVIFNDAGVGLDQAGIASLDYLAALKIPAATVGYDTARIGDGEDMLARGVISHANRLAAQLAARPGAPCHEAAAMLRQADLPDPIEIPPLGETRIRFRDNPVPVWGLDSNSFIDESHQGAIVVTGSHGALLGGRRETAINVHVLAAVYHDAGVGIDRAGISRLPALDAMGIAGATVAGDTARIGDARSLWETGRISFVNEIAKGCGAARGMDIPAFADAIGAHARTTAGIPL